MIAMDGDLWVGVNPLFVEGISFRLMLILRASVRLTTEVLQLWEKDRVTQTPDSTVLTPLCFDH